MCDDCDWEDAAEQAATILDLCEDVPARAESFAESISDKTRGMLEWMEEKEHVTPKMETALNNMQNGIERASQ